MIFELAHELLPYAAVLYVADSVVRVRPGERLIASAWGRRFRWRGPGWHLAGLLPSAEVFVVAAPPAAGSSSAVPAPSSPLAAVEAIRARRAAETRDSAALIAAGAVVLAATFVALPLAVYRRDPTPGPAEAAVAAAAIGWMAVLALGARALRRAGASWGATLSALSPALFFPPAAAHALSFLRRDAYRSSPPLAVAAVVLPPAEFRRLARRELRALDEADRRARSSPGPAAAIGETPRARADIFALLSAAGIDPREATAADPPRDPAAALFCPLCETEYRSGFATCADCDAALIPFAPALTR